jgi:hypothetical protein
MGTNIRGATQRPLDPTLPTPASHPTQSLFCHAGLSLQSQDLLDKGRDISKYMGVCLPSVNVSTLTTSIIGQAQKK